jgi:hypothetical protein
MKQVVAWAMLGSAATSIAMAGHVYGKIRENNQPVQGAGVTLRCGGEAPTGRTDPEGVYRLFSKITGACTLEVNAGGRRAIGGLYSYDRPTAYDFDLVNENGRWVLRKR